MVYNRSGNPGFRSPDIFLSLGGIRLIKVDDGARRVFQFESSSYGAVACTTNIRLVS